MFIHVHVCTGHYHHGARWLIIIGSLSSLTRFKIITPELPHGQVASRPNGRTGRGEIITCTNATLVSMETESILGRVKISLTFFQQPL